MLSFPSVLRGLARAGGYVLLRYVTLGAGRESVDRGLCEACVDPKWYVNLMLFGFCQQCLFLSFFLSFVFISFCFSSISPF
jgi:hypothetical protein